MLIAPNSQWIDIAARLTDVAETAQASPLEDITHPTHFPLSFLSAATPRAMDQSNNLEHPPARPALDLMDLPSELHMQIASYLTYPDALALKHSCRHFYPLVYTGVHLKVDWLVERFERKLECPMEKCSFRTDEAFCNARVRRIMERRRWHRECRHSRGGCWVVEGQTCQTALVPSWLKGQGRRMMVKSMTFWAREGFFPTIYEVFLDAETDMGDLFLRAALIIGIIAVLLQIAWQLMRR